MESFIESEDGAASMLASVLEEGDESVLQTSYNMVNSSVASSVASSVDDETT